MLWKARNNFVFDGHFASPETTLSSAIALAREWSREVKKEPARHLHKPTQGKAPPAGAVVVRSDAAWSSSNNSAGLGWVILSSSGNQSFKAKTRCVGSPLIAESLALREAIITCQNLQIKTVLFESDASQLVKSITDGHCPTELYGVVSDILFYASAFEFVNFSWIPRERNVIADRLAKDALLVSETLFVGDAFTAPN